MLDEVRYWLSGFYPHMWLASFAGVLLLDAPRYVFSKVLLLSIDALRALFGAIPTRPTPYYPSVCAVISCLNEGETIHQTLRSIHGSYPRLRIIVVDDGSTDETYALASAFAESHPEVTVIRLPARGGKSSAINLALNYSDDEIVLTLDSDSEFGKDAIFNIVQPFGDAKVGAVSGSILVRNPYDSICTMLQAYEYLNSILVGRIFSSRIGMLSIASGAFAAFRRVAVDAGYGWDAGPGEDADITIRLRKSGWKGRFEPAAEGFTNAPIRFRQLFKQRLRWDRSLVRYNIRKHRDISDVFSSHFRFTSFLHWLDIMFFNILCTIGLWLYIAGLLFFAGHGSTVSVLIMVFVVYAALGAVQTLTIAFYSHNPRRDLQACLVFPIYVLYAAFLRVARTYAVIDELLNRSSFRDNYVPKYVRDATIHW